MSSFRRAGKMSIRCWQHVSRGNFFAGVPRQRRSLMLVRHRTDSPWRTWGSAPGTRLPTDNQALKARVSSVRSFPFPYALVTLQTERALNLASRIEQAPSPQSSPRKRGEAEWCRVSRTYCRKTRVASCLPSPRSTSATRINYLKLNAC